MDRKKKLGDIGEQMAVSLFETKGCRILKSNYRCKFGEVDLIVQDQDALVFVEVKARSTTAFGGPLEAVTEDKQRKIIETAKHYLTVNPEHQGPIRFDVVAVDLTRPEPQIQRVEGAFLCED